MRYTIFASIVFIAFFHTSILSAEHLDSIEPIGHSTPLAVHAPDSVSIAELKSTNEFITKDSFQKVEDTILPPCDIIFFKSGKIDYCKVIETTPTNISYKMCDYIDGPTIIVNKSTVQKIRYANGKEEIVTSTQPSPNQNVYAKPRKDPLAKLALIFSLCGLLLSIFAIAGLVLGIISLAKINRSRGALSGKGTAIWAICIALLIIILTLATI